MCTFDSFLFARKYVHFIYPILFSILSLALFFRLPTLFAGTSSAVFAFMRQNERIEEKNSRRRKKRRKILLFFLQLPVRQPAEEHSIIFTGEQGGFLFGFISAVPQSFVVVLYPIWMSFVYYYYFYCNDA